VATLNLSTVHLAAPHSAANIAGVVSGSSTVATAALNVQLSTTVSPTLGYDDALAMLAAVANFTRTDRNLPPASRVLNLKIP
jgi:hypothetical protein